MIKPIVIHDKKFQRLLTNSLNTFSQNLNFGVPSFQKHYKTYSFGVILILVYTNDAFFIEIKKIRFKKNEVLLAVTKNVLNMSR